MGTIFLVYRLALPMHTPEMLSSLSKSRISLFNAHLALFIHRMTQLHNPISKYRHLINSPLELALEVRALPSPLADQPTSIIVAELGMNVNVRSSAYE